MRRQRDSGVQFLQLVTYLVRQATRISYAGLALLVFVASDTIQLIYGTGFARSSPLLIILFLCSPLSYCNAFMGQGLYAAGREKQFLRAIVVTTFVSIGLILWRTPSTVTPPLLGS